VFTNNCRASLDVIVFYGLPAEKLRAARDFELISGNWADFEKNQDAAVVGRGVASRRSLRAGSKFSIGDLTVQVAGVYRSNDPAEENYIYTHLDFLQRRKNAELVGSVTQHEVLLEPGIDATAKAEEIDQLFRGGPVATDTRPKGVFQAKSLGDLAQLISLAHYLGYACVGLVLALVATTNVMSVQDRIKEHAVLQTIGFTGSRVFQLVISESMLLSIVGGLAGVAAAMIVLATSHMAVGAEAVTIAFRPSWSLAGTGITVAALVGIVAGLAPGLHAARAEIVPALRA
jgi:putative ABC transport system permease protein